MGARTSTSVKRVRDDLGRDRSPLEESAALQTRETLVPCLSVVHFDDDADEQSSEDCSQVALRAERLVPSHSGRRLAELIEQRIQARTSGRIRNLKVICQDGRVTICGQCATFYTKQLAQHAAMGVIEDETVVNEIAVGFCR